MAGLRTRDIGLQFVLDGPIKGDAFETKKAQVFVPELGRGDQVITDNSFS